MKIFLKSFFFLFALIFLAFASVYGVIVPENIPIRPVGTMQLAPFKDGLSLFQGDTGYYYTFSPFNDYFISPDGARSTYISQEELTNNQYNSNFKKNHWTDIKNILEAYVGDTSPTLTFRAQRETIYTSLIQNNKVTIKQEISKNSRIPIQVVGMTIPFRGTDIVYDDFGQLYTYQPDEDIVAFQQLYGIKLDQPTDDTRSPIPSRKVILVNPHITGVIVVKARENQRLWINQNAKLIEVETLVNPNAEDYTTSIDVEVYPDPIQAQENL